MNSYVAGRMSEAQQVVAAMAKDANLIGSLESAADTCVQSLRKGGKILLAGNGGSAAQAEHIASELVGRFAAERLGLSAMALTADTSILTSLGNDYGYDRIFARQVQAHGKPGDVFVGFSTSGKSPNILGAFEAARKAGLTCIGFTGSKGSRMKPLCDYLLEVPSSDTAAIQEGHLVLGHVLCGLIEIAMFKAPD
jgi:D-sedoheptulose 7-phosphate isomerase